MSTDQSTTQATTNATTPQPSRKESSPSTAPSGPSTILTFFALYLTTLFSLDTWAAARSSPYRAPSANSVYYRPANMPPARDSYQGQMHGRGNHGPSDGNGGGRGVGRLPQAVDSRPPLRMGGNAACGACMM